MELRSEQLIPQARPVVWQALNDPEVLRACISGCESLEQTSENEYKVVIAAAIGPVKARFNGKLQISDVVVPESYAISFEGNGGVAGFGKGTANVALQDEGEHTRLAYSVAAKVGGKIAQVGSRLIDGVARKLADDFFTAFNARVAAPPAEPVPGDAPAEADGESGKKAGWLDRWKGAARQGG